MGAGAGQRASRCPAGGRTQEASLYAGSLCLSAEYRSQAGDYLRTGESAAEPKAANLRGATAVEKPRGGKVQKKGFPPRLEIPQKARDSHFPTATTAATRLHL